MTHDNPAYDKRVREAAEALLQSADEVSYGDDGYATGIFSGWVVPPEKLQALRDALDGMTRD